MIIPIFKTKLEVGDNVVFVEDLILDYCIITVGHVMKINAIYNTPRLSYDLVDGDNGLCVTRVKNSYVQKQVNTIDEAKELVLSRNRREYIYAKIKLFCPHIRYDCTEDYCDKSLCNKYNGGYCIPSLRCLEYIHNKYIYNDSKFKSLLRLEKLSTIKKRIETK